MWRASMEHRRGAAQLQQNGLSRFGTTEPPSEGPQY